MVPQYRVQYDCKKESEWITEEDSKLQGVQHLIEEFNKKRLTRQAGEQEVEVEVEEDDDDQADDEKTQFVNDETTGFQKTQQKWQLRRQKEMNEKREKEERKKIVLGKHKIKEVIPEEEEED